MALRILYLILSFVLLSCSGTGTGEDSGIDSGEDGSASGEPGEIDGGDVFSDGEETNDGESVNGDFGDLSGCEEMTAVVLLERGGCGYRSNPENVVPPIFELPPGCEELGVWLDNVYIWTDEWCFNQFMSENCNPVLEAVNDTDIVFQSWIVVEIYHHFNECLGTRLNLHGVWECDDGIHVRYQVRYHLPDPECFSDSELHAAIAIETLRTDLITYYEMIEE
jgi:hypothetical protein